MTSCDCCEEVRGGSPPTPGVVTCANIGAGAEWYVTGTSGPFEFRTLVSDGSVIIAQSADEIAISVPPATPLTNVGGGEQIFNGTPNELRTITASGIATASTIGDTVNIAVPAPTPLSNVGTGAEVFNGTPNELRTFTSPLGTISFVENGDEIEADVVGGAFSGFQFQGATLSVTTNVTAYGIVWTSAAIPMLIGESWQVICRWLTANLSGLSTVNVRNRWLVETAPAVFSVLEDNLNQNEQLPLSALNVGSPRERAYRIIAAMNNPRMQLQMSMSAAVATGGLTQNPGILATRKA